VHEFKIHPNGREATFHNQAYGAEWWTLKNYLPKKTPAATANSR